MTITPATVDGVWMSVSGLAKERNVSKQAVSKRLHGLAGKVATRRNGRELLVNVVEYDRATAAETDPAQQLRNLFQEPARTEPPAADATNTYSEERAKRERYAAELARLDLEERTGKLLKVADVEAAMVRFGELLVRVIDQMPASTDNLEVRGILKTKAHELRELIASDMKLMTSVTASQMAGDDDGD